MLTAEMLDQIVRDAVPSPVPDLADFVREYIICHPDDLDELRQKLTSRRLIPLRGEA